MKSPTSKGGIDTSVLPGASMTFAIHCQQFVSRAATIYHKAPIGDSHPRSPWRVRWRRARGTQHLTPPAGIKDLSLDPPGGGINVAPAKGAIELRSLCHRRVPEALTLHTRIFFIFCNICRLRPKNCTTLK